MHPSEPKRVEHVERRAPLHWVGDGFPVRTLLSYDRHARAASPFLLLDYAAPHEFSPTGHRRGVGEHPHRGFETVTVVYQGELEHRDSSGATGRIGPGEVQWMTAARGVIHEERHGRAFAEAGGTLEMVQVWVNLPRALKMSPPRYQDLTRDRIPEVDLPEGAGSARVIAGDLLGTPGPAETSSPVDLLDLRLESGAPASLELPDGYTAIVLGRRGSLVVNGQETIGPGELALLGHEGSRLELEARADASALLLAGAPLGEPVVGRGPFVMSTEGELRQAFLDFQAGRLGRP